MRSYSAGLLSFSTQHRLKSSLHQPAAWTSSLPLDYHHPARYTVQQYRCRNKSQLLHTPPHTHVWQGNKRVIYPLTAIPKRTPHLLTATPRCNNPPYILLSTRVKISRREDSFDSAIRLLCFSSPSWDSKAALYPSCFLVLSLVVWLCSNRMIGFRSILVSTQLQCIHLMTCVYSPNRMIAAL